MDMRYIDIYRVTMMKTQNGHNSANDAYRMMNMTMMMMMTMTMMVMMMMKMKLIITPPILKLQPPVFAW